VHEPSAEIDQWAHRVIGAAIEVHRHLGPGLLEAVYETALAHEFDLREIPYQRQASVQITYNRSPPAKVDATLLWRASCPLN
jgi:GxxExxY protein